MLSEPEPQVTPQVPKTLVAKAAPTPRPRHWGQAHRPPDLDKEARLAALGAHEIKLRAAKFDPHEERGAVIPEERPSFRSRPFPERRSVFARLFERLTDRRD